MQLSLRPYVTTGVALVGASVIAAAPIQPACRPTFKIPNAGSAGASNRSERRRSRNSGRGHQPISWAHSTNWSDLPIGQGMVARYTCTSGVRAARLIGLAGGSASANCSSGHVQAAASKTRCNILGTSQLHRSTHCRTPRDPLGSAIHRRPRLHLAPLSGILDTRYSSTHSPRSSPRWDRHPA